MHLPTGISELDIQGLLCVLSILLALTKDNYKRISLTETADSINKREKDIFWFWVVLLISLALDIFTRTPKFDSCTGVCSNIVID